MEASIIIAIILLSYLIPLVVLSLLGYFKLAKIYRHRGDIFGEKTESFVSFKVNFVRYNCSHSLYCNENGFYLKPIFIIRPMHPTVFIPWKDVRFMETPKSPFIECLSLEIGNPKIANLGFQIPTMEKIRLYNTKL